MSKMKYYNYKMKYDYKIDVNPLMTFKFNVK
jgi:hypothetical protein